MNPILEAILAIFAGIAFVVILVLTINWGTHISQTKDFTNKYGWGNYSKFKHHFDQYDWERVGCSDRYLKTGDCEYGAHIIEFKGIGMIMRTPIDLFLADLYVDRYISKRWGLGDKRGGYKW